MGEPALGCISFQLPPGTFAALVGPGGCGLSSLLRLLATRLAPSTGAAVVTGQRRIVYDDSITDKQAARLMRCRTAFVPREAPILCGSVFANIAFAAAEDCTAKDVERAAAL